MIDLEKMSKEHQQLFPLSTAEGQFNKLEEELCEVSEAFVDCNYEKMYREKADVIIVCAGLYRWFPKTAVSVAKGNGLFDSTIAKEVKKKWKVNLSRTWEYKDGKYHHTNKDGWE